MKTACNEAVLKFKRVPELRQRNDVATSATKYW